MKEGIKNKKGIVLEDLFFKDDGDVLSVIRNLKNYDTVIYYDMELTSILDAYTLEEYMARLDTYIDAQFIQFPNKYDKVIMYRFVIDYIQGEIEYQKKHPFDDYEEHYDGMSLNLNPIIEIKQHSF